MNSHSYNAELSSASHLSARFAAAVDLFGAKQYAAALAAFEDLAQLVPNEPAVQANLIICQIKCGAIQAAVMTADNALSCAEPTTDLLAAIGQALTAAGRPSEAILAFRTAIQRAPVPPDTVLINLANLLLEAESFEAAQECLETLRRQSPDSLELLALEAALAHKQKTFDTAIALYQALLKADPANKDALLGLATCWGEQDLAAKAIPLYSQLLALPELSDRMAMHAWRNLGHCLYRQGAMEEAVSAFQQAHCLSPDPEMVTPYLISALNSVGRWQESEGLSRDLLEDAAGEAATIPPFVLVSLGANETVLTGATKRYAAGLTTAVGTCKPLNRGPFSHRTGRLRVGYISPDFGTHSVGAFFQQLLAHHTRQNFEWFGYSLETGTKTGPSATAALFDHFTVLTPQTAEATAGRIAADELDLLIDLSGHTRNNALAILAWRPAPLQAHYFGYGQTLGLDYIDYLITDKTVIPAALACQIPEHVAYLPHSFMAVAPRDSAAQEMPEAVRPMIYASFNALQKLDSALFTTWLTILDAVPDSQLWISCNADTALSRLQARAREQGIEASRLVAAPFLARDAHFQRLAKVGLILDSQRHCGGASTLDALAIGVPVLSRTGDAPSKRTGASLLHAATLPDLIVNDLSAYAAKAIAIGTDVALRQSLFRRLHQAHQTAPLFQMPRHAAYLEQLYREIITRQRKSEKPRRVTIDV